MAFARVTIDSPPGDEQYSARVVPVASADLLAGALPHGGLKEIEEAAASNDDNLLPAGSYLLLVGTTPTASRYFLSDGLRGSFVSENGVVSQRCTNTANPASPTAVRGSVTDADTLTALFAEALSD